MTETNDKQEKTIPFFPDHFMSEFRMTIAITVIIVIIGVAALAYPVGLGEPADPLKTPEHIKPEWYFLALYQLLKYVSKTAGVLLPILGMILVFIWPFIDKKPDSKRQMWIRLIGSIVFTILIIAATVWGEVS
jgi:quinol-cytochrome oxidoreductase complex cytochrome b subunit